MGVHSTTYIATTVARRLYKENVGSDLEVTDKQLEDFYDRVLDDHLYNCLLVSDDSENLKPALGRTAISELALTEYLTRYIAENPGERHNSVTGENAKLRGMLAQSYLGLPTGVDFTRDTAAEIERKLEHFRSWACPRDDG